MPGCPALPGSLDDIPSGWADRKQPDDAEASLRPRAATWGKCRRPHFDYTRNVVLVNRASGPVRAPPHPSRNPSRCALDRLPIPDDEPSTVASFTLVHGRECCWRWCYRESCCPLQSRHWGRCRVLQRDAVLDIDGILDLHPRGRLGGDAELDHAPANAGWSRAACRPSHNRTSRRLR